MITNLLLILGIIYVFTPERYFKEIDKWLGEVRGFLGSNKGLK